MIVARWAARLGLIALLLGSVALATGCQSKESSRPPASARSGPAPATPQAQENTPPGSGGGADKLVPPAPVRMIGFNDTGVMLDQDARDLDAVIKEAGAKPPTHIFVAIHGFLNTRDTATKSYEKMRTLMFEMAKDRGLQPANYVPLRIGVAWPSMKPPPEKEDKELDATVRAWVADALGEEEADKIKEILERNAKMGTAAFKADLAKVHDLLHRQAKKIGIEIPEQPPALANVDEQTIREVLQLHTYWQMKERAGIVGASGVRKLVSKLQNEFPNATIHLIGHSFGTKVVLSALIGEALPRKVDTVILLQGAVSFQSFSDKVEGIASSPPGGYRAAAERVNGPIVVTFSTKDLSVGLVYPRASRIAKQIGECAEKAGNLVALDLYQGLGGVGVRGQKSVAMLPVGGEYHFQKGLNCIDATNFIVPIGDNPDAHSQIYTPEVAWLLWAAVLRR